MMFRLPFLILVVLLAGCAGLPAPESEAPPPVSRNGAVVALVDHARADAAAGRDVKAGAGLERALRIEPRNPALWQELAKLRFSQGKYAEAEGLARRSNSFAGDDRRLRSENWQLIGDARTRLGREAEAHDAFRHAEELAR